MDARSMTIVIHHNCKKNLVTQIMMDPRMDEPRCQMVFLLWGGKVLLLKLPSDQQMWPYSPQ